MAARGDVPCLTTVTSLPHTPDLNMLRHVIVGFLLAALAYVCCVPLPVLHRAKRWEEFPNVSFTFDCSDRAVGFYADVEHHCQIFHMCDEDGRRIPYICANDTSFNQQYRICDWDYNFECQETPQWYYLNELTYVTDPPQPKLRNSVARDQPFV